jgi:hypothetical protein
MHLRTHGQALLPRRACVLSAVFEEITPLRSFLAVHDMTGQSVICPNAALCSHACTLVSVRPVTILLTSCIQSTSYTGIRREWVGQDERVDVDSGMEVNNYDGHVRDYQTF